MHREADNVGTAFDRNIGTVILFEGRTGDRVPSGAVIISTLDELLQQILWFFVTACICTFICTFFIILMGIKMWN